MPPVPGPSVRFLRLWFPGHFTYIAKRASHVGREVLNLGGGTGGLTSESSGGSRGGSLGSMEPLFYKGLPSKISACANALHTLRSH